MTIQKTVEYFKEMVKGKGSCELCPCGTDDMEMTKIALAALEKQIPKKPYEETIATEDGYMTKKRSFFYCCPNCFNHLNENQKHCDDCGQALDWGDTK